MGMNINQCSFIFPGTIALFTSCLEYIEFIRYLPPAARMEMILRHLTVDMSRVATFTLLVPQGLISVKHLFTEEEWAVWASCIEGDQDALRDEMLNRAEAYITERRSCLINNQQ
jgi:hypothetical protein